MILANSLSVSVIVAMVATSALATVPGNQNFLLEIRTGGKESAIVPAAIKPVVQAQLTNPDGCEISVGAGEFLVPLISVMKGGVYEGDIRPCQVGSVLVGEVAGYGEFTIDFLPNNGTCHTVTDSCRPVLTFRGESHPMWRDDGNCDYTNVTGDYDLYRCGFVLRN